ncbi:MAG: hypothetical protein PGN26_13980 [Xylophilus ampelinus]
MNYLVYVAHGADWFCDEAAYSMLSFWRRHGESLAAVLVATDRPEYFARLLGADAPVRYVRLDAPRLAAWRGADGYVHRIKPLALAHAAAQAGAGAGDAVLFADSDTVFDGDVAPVFAAIARDEGVWLHAREGTIASGRRLTRSQAKLHRAARRHDFMVDGAPWRLPPELPLWNSGLIGVRGDRLADLARATVAAIDAIRPRLAIPTVEQIALSAVLARRGTPIHALERSVFHYYNFKEFRDDLARFFAALDGRSRADKQARLDAIAPALRGAPKAAFMAQPKWWRQVRKHLGRNRRGWTPLPFPDLDAPGAAGAPSAPAGERPPRP